MLTLGERHREGGSLSGAVWYSKRSQCPNGDMRSVYAGLRAQAAACPRTQQRRDAQPVSAVRQSSRLWQRATRRHVQVRSPAGGGGKGAGTNRTATRRPLG